MSHPSRTTSLNSTDPETFSPEYVAESRVHWILIPVTLFSVLVTTLVGLRFWARKLGTGNGLGADDWTCLVAMIFALTTNALFIGTTYNGFGLHVKTLAPETLSQGLFLWWFAQITYKISLQLTKISLLQLYLRIFSHLIPWFKRTAYVLIAVLALYTVATCSVSFAQCTPITDAWAVVSPPPPSAEQDPNRAIMRPAKNCINLKAFFIFNGVFALLTDLIVLLVPIPMIYTLNPARHQKVALVPLFALGTFIVVISTQRLFFLVTSKPGKDDLTYDLLSTLWTIVEYNLGICCACGPIVRVFVLKVWGGVDSSRRGDGGLRVMNSREGRTGRGRSGSSRGYRDGKDDDEFDLVDAHMGGNATGRKSPHGSYSTNQSDTRGRGHDRTGSNASGYGYAYSIEGGHGYSQTGKKGDGSKKSKEKKTIQIGPRYLYYSRSRSSGRTKSTNNSTIQTTSTTKVTARRVTTERGRSDSSSDSEVSLILQTPEPLVSPTPSGGGGSGGDDLDYDGASCSYGRRGRSSSGADGMMRLERTVSPRYASSYDVEEDYRAQGLR
ncbi:hypothetical protein V8F20_011935 [Naviculisporaceae sp. PSN 640]